MEKIIARELTPDEIDFMSFFDDDGLRSEGGENCAIYIPSTRNTRGFNVDEYKDILQQAESVWGYFDEYYDSYDEFIRTCGIKCSRDKLERWVKETNDLNAESIAEFLTITTGKQYNVRSFSGYNQSDYCEVIYCVENHSEESIEMVGKAYLGCITEFCIDDCYGFYVTDDIRYEAGNKLKEYLADLYGCTADDLEVQLYTGSHMVADYETI